MYLVKKFEVSTCSDLNVDECLQWYVKENGWKMDFMVQVFNCTQPLTQDDTKSREKLSMLVNESVKEMSDYYYNA